MWCKSHLLPHRVSAIGSWSLPIECEAGNFALVALSGLAESFGAKLVYPAPGNLGLWSFDVELLNA